jgi:phospholipase/lecithinase/hemolysin
MEFLMNSRTRLAAACAAALATALLASCGGGGDGDQSTSFQYNRVVSFGDSLSDVGTSKVGTVLALTAAQGGGRWSTSTPAGGDIWVERLAAQLKVGKPCPAETGLSPNLPGVTGAPVTAKAGCFSYAQGSARITDRKGPVSVALQALGESNLGLTAKPIKDQMAAHLAAAGGS